MPFYIGDITDATPKKLMQTAGVHYLRFPGGSSANFYIWDFNFTAWGSEPYFESEEKSMMKQMNTDQFIAL